MYLAELFLGRDTTAQTLSWAFWEIAQHPEIYQKIRDEAIAVCGPTGKATYDKLKDLKYATAVFNETLRVHPNVPNSQKLALQDCVLPGTGTQVYAGQRVQWSSYCGFLWRSLEQRVTFRQAWDTRLKSGDLTATSSK